MTYQSRGVTDQTQSHTILLEFSGKADVSNIRSIKLAYKYTDPM